ncbi:MAG: PQQ-binding-like beta-propeller repeat protein [Verrucomicrobiae bacterium]|nr:PQQ-binding-like beta-propeller repeat protein [Verrucomicrobiae bacterium]
MPDQPANPSPAPAPKPPAPGDEHPWKEPARRVAWVAGIYCAILSVALVVSYFQSRRVNPVDHPQLAQWKAALVQQPANEKLKQQIRELDLELRAAYFRYVTRVQRSGWLLLGGALVLLPALYFATWRRRLPRPGKYVARPDLYERDARLSRLAVGAVTVVGLGAALWAVKSSQSDLEVVLAKKPAPASPESRGAPSLDTSFPTREEMARQWPRFRGPEGAGVSVFTNLPVKWDGESGEGIVWKTPLPYGSPNSPVVWSNRIFMTGGNSGTREVFCVDADTGKLLWQQPVGKPGKRLPPEDEEGRFYATSTCATDGRRVYAIFETGDLAAFDFQGNSVWQKSLGKPDNQYGHSASLEVYKNLLIVQWDQGDEEAKKSVIYAFNTATGAEVWKTAPRPVGASWSTPIVAQAGQRLLLVANANPWLMAYDPDTGAELWRAQVCHGEVAPSPIVAGGLVLTANEELVATKPDGSGDVTKTHVLWKQLDGIPDICSPVSDGQYVYLLTSSGILTVYEVATGKRQYEHELEINFKASPCVAGGRLYLWGEEGVTILAAAGPKFQELGRNKLPDMVFATPAFVNGRIYVRGKTHLYCLGSKSP